jgi:dTDP-4-dehydrorhamnose reductase
MPRHPDTPLRIAVTGAHGQIASALQDLATRPGAAIQLVALARPELDLERPETIAPALRAARPDILISAAAFTAVDAAETAREQAMAVNGVAPGVLAAEAARLGVPIIHLSTDYVFDGTKPAPYVESDPTGPATVYGETKLAGERAVAAANPDHAVVRTAWVYAPQGKNFVLTMLRLAETRERVGVVADQIGNPSYSLDIADGLIALAQAMLRGEGAPGVYHMAGGDKASWADFAEAIFAGARRRGGPAAAVDRIASAAYPTPAKRPANSQLDCAKLRDGFGIELPAWPLALDRCLDRIFADRRN